MSPADQSGVELVQQGFAAFSSGDWDEALKTMHPEVEWHDLLRWMRPFDTEAEAMAAAGVDPGS